MPNQQTPAQNEAVHGGDQEPAHDAESTRPGSPLLVPLSTPRPYYYFNEKPTGSIGVVRPLGFKPVYHRLTFVPNPSSMNTERSQVDAGS